MTASAFFLALAVMGLSVAAILAWEIHTSRPRESPKEAGLRAANRGPAALHDQLERERKERGLP